MKSVPIFSYFTIFAVFLCSKDLLGSRKPTNFAPANNNFFDLF